MCKWVQGGGHLLAPHTYAAFATSEILFNFLSFITHSHDNPSHDALQRGKKKKRARIQNVHQVTWELFSTYTPLLSPRQNTGGTALPSDHLSFIWAGNSRFSINSGLWLKVKKTSLIIKQIYIECPPLQLIVVWPKWNANALLRIPNRNVEKCEVTELKLGQNCIQQGELAGCPQRKRKYSSGQTITESAWIFWDDN